ncbi:MAG TPA: hypothetical protein PKD46_04425 [Aggregatilineaceae bacterium]|nr:hypothetical protein [Aggregatilineaceae bacterium]
MITMRRWLDDDFTVTKRQLGALLIAAGTLAIAAMLAAEIDPESGGFGLAQRAGAALGALALALGLTLLPLGDRPA